jgi:hypothetical protein
MSPLDIIAGAERVATVLRVLGPVADQVDLRAAARLRARAG